MPARPPTTDTLRSDSLPERVLAWYAENARDLPWRQPAVSAWGVLVSEVMLQQTPVARVEPVWREWLERWPRPADLATTPTAEVLRAWGRLGYPRRALRLQQAAVQIVAEHGGEVPEDVTLLRGLPGVGEYTAAAIAAFGFQQRHAVLDSNVRRVLARWETGRAHPRSSSITAGERSLADSLLPSDGLAPMLSVGLMELGALVCTARAPRCGGCPIADGCRWLAAGQPPAPRPGGQAPFEGSDRQARGFVMAQLRSYGRTELDRLRAEWRGPGEQAGRAVASLVADGLAVIEDDAVRLP